MPDTIPTNGCRVRDKITGFTGVVIAETKWLNGCQRVTVQTQTLKDGRPVDPVSFDIQQVEVVSEAENTMAPPTEVLEKKPGGPTSEPTRNADPS